MSPRIGITCETDEKWEQWYRSYANAVEAWGATTAAITRDLALGRTPDSVLAEFDGLLLTGGPDIALNYYPNPPDRGGKSLEEFQDEHHMSTSPSRDEYEFPLAKRGLEIDFPILGICHGIQLLNVAMGGQLILDIPADKGLGNRIEHRALPPAEAGGPRPSSNHPVIVKPTSRLAHALAPIELTIVNSRHHQGITKELLAEGLEPVAFSSDDGLIEAVESPKHRWVIGVQWHPEKVDDRYVYEPCRPLFRSFVEASGFTRCFRA